MKTVAMSINESDHSIRSIIEQHCGRKIRNAADCTWLSLDMESKIGCSLSVNTLKRMLGILSYSKSHNMSSLDLLARYIGYGCWEDVDKERNKKVSAFGENKDLLESSILETGTLVNITYNPNRQIEMEYMGGDRYKVLDSVNSKLKVNDVVVIYQMMLHHPLIVADVLREGHSLGTYQAALDGGLISMVVNNK